MTNNTRTVSQIQATLNDVCADQFTLGWARECVNPTDKMIELAIRTQKNELCWELSLTGANLTNNVYD